MEAFLGGLIGAFTPGSAGRVAGDLEALSEPEAFRGERTSWNGPGGHVTAYRWAWEPVPLAFDRRCVVAIQGELFGEGGPLGADALLERWRQRGEGALEGLDGEFAGIAWDSAARALFLFRDAFGTRPLFFAGAGRVIGVGTEIRQAARAASLPLQPDPRLVAREARGRQTFGRKTLYLGVSRVLPSEALRIDGEGSTSRAVWSFPAVVSRRLEAAEVAQELPGALRKAAFRRGGRQILLLSGGLDSTSIAAAAPDRFEGALTIAYPGHECDDTERAASVAKMHRLRHEVLDITRWGPVRCLAETMRDCDQLPGMTAYQVRPAMERVRALGGEVAVLGLGGDDFFLPPAVALVDALTRDGPSAALRAAAELVRDRRTGQVPVRRFARHLVRSLAMPRLRKAFAPAIEWKQRPQLLARFDPRGDVERWRDVSAGRWRALEVLARAWSGSAREVLEQLSARAGVGIAFPFFDRAIAEMATSAWADEVLGRSGRKDLLANAFHALLPEPITLGWRGPLVPEPVVAEIVRAKGDADGPGGRDLSSAIRAWSRLRTEFRLSGQES